MHNICHFSLPILLAVTTAGFAAEPVTTTSLPASAFPVSQQTATDAADYLPAREGRNGRLYIGTPRNGANAYLVEFDPPTKKMTTVVDVMKEIGSNAKGFAAQAKIHTRNNVGASGKIYFGT